MAEFEERFSGGALFLTMEAESIQKIIAFADRAHGNQQRRYTGERYIVHPIRVMETCLGYSNDPAVLSAALLHDVLEDTPVSVDEIRGFLREVLPQHSVEEAINLVVELTDIYTKKDYPRLNRRQRRQNEFKRLHAASANAQTIKYADIIDNTIDIVNHDPDFARVFLAEASALLDNITRGNPDLYQRAQDTVANCIRLLIKKPV